MIETVFHASPHWLVTGWLGSIAMLLTGLVIAHLYYDGPDADRPNRGRSQ